jgi:hypothetical protein
VRERGELPALVCARLRRHATQKEDVSPKAHLLGARENALQLRSSRVDHEDERKLIQSGVVVRELPRRHEGLPVALSFCRKARQVKVAQVRVDQEIGGRGDDD